MKLLLRHMLLFVIGCFVQLLYAQNEADPFINDDSPIIIQEISEDDIDTYRNNDAFNYEEGERKNTIIDRFFDWLGNVLRNILEFLFGEGQASGILAFIFRVVPYLILAVLIFLLIRFFLKVNAENIVSGTANKSTVAISEEEELIKYTDLNQLIKEAVKQQNYRLAVRYYYLLALKYLSASQHINWAQQKTNNDYIAEISSPQLKTQFSHLTRIYDYVWYGEFPVDQMQFDHLKSSFENLNQHLK